MSHDKLQSEIGESRHVERSMMASVDVDGSVRALNDDLDRSTLARASG